MTANCTLALIVAKPGPLRDALRSLMIAMPQIDAVEEANDLSSALRADLKRAPRLVLLDAKLADGETWLAVRLAKARWPQARCMFMADGVRQQQEAEAAGADAVLIKGVLPARLVATLVRLLPQQGGREDTGDVAVSCDHQRHRAQRLGRRLGLTL